MCSEELTGASSAEPNEQSPHGHERSTARTRAARKPTESDSPNEKPEEGEEGEITEDNVVAQALGSIQLLPLHDDRAEARFPVLLALLKPKYGEKQKLIRQEGRLSIAVWGPCWRVSLECPTEAITTTIEVNSLATLFESLERVLRNGKAVWTQAYKKRKRDLTALANQVK